MVLARARRKHDMWCSSLHRLGRSCLLCLLHMEWCSMFIWSSSLGSQLTLAPTLQVKMATKASKTTTQRLNKDLKSDNKDKEKKSSDINPHSLDRDHIACLWTGSSVFMHFGICGKKLSVWERNTTAGNIDQSTVRSTPPATCAPVCCSRRTHGLWEYNHFRLSETWSRPLQPH